jgi:hypothetical protein
VQIEELGEKQMDWRREEKLCVDLIIECDIPVTEEAVD